MRIVHSGQLDLNTPQTPGMTRAAAINRALAGANKLWAGTVSVHPNAKTAPHHHGALESIIYIISGSGGAQLYDPGLSNKPELWTHGPKANWVPFTVKLISDVHSFTWVETDGKTMSLKQIKYTGETIDEIKITK